ncbi:carbon-nitrogen hydrolase [Chaetomium fimeti]|uniref:Carbon-nitrogen hydrolase n=1 Tax=Chaetomium fimeti TaxID=1854472 RepID=A0AAE0LVS7_9PEZI|nr:carbon-nitrogen hydrolase [Chaetomium fimeti]
MRIGCLQFAPKVGDVPNNIMRAEAVLSRADPDDRENLDLLVLPEMAFSEYYNSLVVVDDNGEKLAGYSKSFLYYTDATWANEGRGFYGGKLGRLGQTALGICIPYKFEAPWDAYEFAFHVLHVRANLVILSTAWLTNDEQSAFLSSPDAPDLSTLAYWVARLEPVIRAHSSEETIVVFANRCGVEDEATYAGSSAVIGIKDGEVSVYGILGRGVEELLVVDTEKPPFGKLVNPLAAPVAEEPGAPPAPPSPAREDDPEDGPPKGPAGTGPHARPKLSLQTNLPISSAPIALPSPDDSTHPLSAIPIFVDVYTPDEPDELDEPDESSWRDGAVKFDLGALSPWSVASWRSSGSVSNSAASSPLGSHCGGVIRVAASPSVFRGGFLGGRGVCV